MICITLYTQLVKNKKQFFRVFGLWALQVCLKVHFRTGRLQMSCYLPDIEENGDDSE
jgi:hypothetical protein